MFEISRTGGKSMNERYEQLMAQAWIEFAPDAKAVTKRFAELIVKECLDVVAMRIYLGSEEICRQECKALASEIKEHFGVEL
jgi:hypothetical protein